jgi:hypothetical protein
VLTLEENKGRACITVTIYNVCPGKLSLYQAMA